MRRSGAVALIIATVLGLGTAACTTPPADLEAGEAPPKDTAEAGLWMVAKRTERQVKTSGKLVEDAALQRYVNDLACRISPPYCSDIRVYVVRHPDFNAYMMPNGMMAIWSGLLLRTVNEAQLAMIIGHEIGHFQRRHAWHRLEEAKATANVAMMLNVAAAMAGVGQVGDLINLIARGHLAAFSRDHEREADDLGFKMLVDTGYAAKEAPRIWRGMLAEQDAGDLEEPPPFLATHPPEEERMATLKEKAAAYSGDGGADATRAGRYLERILPHRSAWLKDELDLRRWARVQVVLDRLREQGARPGELLFYQGELYRRRARDGDVAKAIEVFRKAARKPGVPAAVHRSLGLALWSQGRKDAAREAFRDYLAAAPDGEDTDMVRSYIDRLEDA